MVVLPVYQETFVYYARFIFFYVFVWYDLSFDIKEILALYVLITTYPVLILSEQILEMKKKRKKLLLEKLKQLADKEELDLDEFYYLVERYGAPRLAERIIEYLKEVNHPVGATEIAPKVYSNYNSVINILNILADIGVLCKLENVVNLCYKDYIAKGNPNCPLRIRNKCNKCSQSQEELLWT